jgi:hypothetical protein
MQGAAVLLVYLFPMLFKLPRIGKLFGGLENWVRAAYLIVSRYTRLCKYGPYAFLSTTLT